MNKNKITLLKLIDDIDISGLSLREISKMIGCKGKPQIVKHHLSSLVLAGFVKIYPGNKIKISKDGKALLMLMQENKSLFNKIIKLFK